MAEGLFGSNVGGKASQRIKPLDLAPPKPLKAETLKAPTTHSPHFASSTHVPSSLTRSAALTASSTTWGMGSALDNQGGSSGILGDVTGFIGHLGSDIVHTTMGMPAGIMYMFEHPIAGAEGAVKATWADWSPLFHGDFGLWAHNFFEHPLAPILDVAGLATGGAAIAAKAADVAAVLGTRSLVSESAAAATAGDAARAASLSDAAVARATTGSAAFGNIGRSVLAEHIDIVAKAAGRNFATKTTEDIAKAEHAVNYDSRATRLIQGEGGDQLPRTINNNPLLAWRNRHFEAAANKIGATKLADKLPPTLKFGDQGTYQRWSHLDKGRRAAAMTGTVLHQIKVMHNLGELLGSMSAVEKFQTLISPIHGAMYANGRAVAKDVIEKPGGLAKLSQSGLGLLIDEKHLADKRAAAAGGKMLDGINKLTDRVAKVEARIPGEAGHDAALNVGLRNIGKFVTVQNEKDLAMAARTPNGDYLAISNQMAHRMANEAKNSYRVARDVYQTPVKVWRYAMLGLSPRYFVNNFIGNSIMLMAATDPVSLYKAFRQHVAIQQGSEIARLAHEENIRLAISRMPSAVQAHHLGLAEEKFATERAQAAATGGLNPLDRHLAGEHQGLSRSAIADSKVGKGGLSGAFTTITAKNPLNFYGITHKWADLPGRYMAMNYSLMRDSSYQAYLAHFLDKGEGHQLAAYHAAEEALKSGRVRNTVAIQVKHMLGQYHTFTKYEKGLKGNLVPFYSWYRAIADHTRHIVTDESYKAAMGAAIGAQGAKKQKDMMGQLPDFMLGVVPKGLMPGVIQSMMGSSPGRTAGVNMTSMIPYGTIGDETNMVGALLGAGHLTPGDTIGSALNPLLQSGVEQLTGTSLSTGIPTKPTPGGPIAGTALGMFSHLPQVTLFNDATGNGDSSVTSKGKPTLYEKGVQASLSSWLGIPIKQVSEPAAQAIEAKQQHTKKPKNGLNLPAL